MQLISAIGCFFSTLVIHLQRLYMYYILFVHAHNTGILCRWFGFSFYLYLSLLSPSFFPVNTNFCLSKLRMSRWNWDKIKFLSTTFEVINHELCLCVNIVKFNWTTKWKCGWLRLSLVTDSIKGACTITAIMTQMTKPKSKNSYNK